MSFAEMEKERKEHFESLDCRCPICGNRLEYVMMYEDHPQYYSGACKICKDNFHFWKNGKNKTDNTLKHNKLKKMKKRKKLRVFCQDCKFHEYGPHIMNSMASSHSYYDPTSFPTHYCTEPHKIYSYSAICKIDDSDNCHVKNNNNNCKYFKKKKR